MMSNVTVMKKIPSNVVKTAESVLQKHARGLLVAKRHNRQKDWRALDVMGGNYRLFSKNKGETWTLCSHSQYNKLLTAKL